MISSNSEHYNTKLKLDTRTIGNHKNIDCGPLWALHQYGMGDNSPKCFIEKKTYIDTMTVDKYTNYYKSPQDILKIVYSTLLKLLYICILWNDLSKHNGEDACRKACQKTQYYVISRNNHAMFSTELARELSCQTSTSAKGDLALHPDMRLTLLLKENPLYL